MDDDDVPVQRVLVLSGGGGKGIYEAACLRAMLAQHPDLDFDAFVGISAGALNAAYLAGAAMSAFGSDESRQSLRKRVKSLVELWLGVGSFRGVYRGDVRKKLQVFWRVLVMRNPGAVDAAPIRAMIDEHIRASEIRASGRRLLVGMTQLDTGLYVERDELDDEIADVVKASSAIPAAFAPVWLRDGRRYVDGAIRNNTPLASAYHMRPRQEIVAIQTTPIRIENMQEASLEADLPTTNADETRDALDILAHSARIMSEEVQKDDIEGAWRWHWVLRALAAGNRALPGSHKIAVPTRIWAPKDTLLRDEKIFEREDLVRMCARGDEDGRLPPRLDFDRDAPSNAPDRGVPRQS